MRTVRQIRPLENVGFGIQTQAEQSAWYDGAKDSANVVCSGRSRAHVSLDTGRDFEGWLLEQPLRGRIMDHGEAYGPRIDVVFPDGKRGQKMEGEEQKLQAMKGSEGETRRDSRLKIS